MKKCIYSSALSAVLFLFISTESFGLSNSGTDFYLPFQGKWIGTLEYRDYSNNKRVTLPTELEVLAGNDDKTMTFNYTYDDGPGKTEKSSSEVSFDLIQKKYISISGDGKSRDEYAMKGLNAFARAGGGTLVLTGKGMENDKAVDVRSTLTVTKMRYVLKRETRLPGKKFLFRHVYRFKRVK